MYPHFLLGWVYAELRQGDDAKKSFEAALSIDINKEYHGRAYYGLGCLYDNWGLSFSNTNQSKTLFLKSIEYSDYPVDTLLKLRYKYRDLRDQIKILEKGLISHQNNISLNIQLSQLYKRNNNSENAITLLMELVNRGITCVSVHFNLGNCYLASNDYSSSKAHFHKALELNSEKINNGAILHKLAYVYLHEQCYSEAISLYHEAFIEDISNTNCWIHFVAICIIHKHVDCSKIILELLGKRPMTKDEIEYVDICSSYSPFWLDADTYEDIDVDYNLTNVLAILKSLKPSSVDFSSSILYNYWMFIASFSKERGRTLDRYSALKKALNYIDYDNNKDVFVELSDAYNDVITSKINTGSDASKCIESLISDIISQNEFKQIALKNSLSSIVKSLYEANQYKLIVDILSKYDNESIVVSDAMFEYAYSLNELKHTKNAQYFYEQVIVANPKSSAAYNNLANIIKADGDLNKAIELYKKAIENDANDKIATSNLQNTQQQLESSKFKEVEKQQKDNTLKNAVELLKQENVYVISILNELYTKAKSNPILKLKNNEIEITHNVRN